MFCVHLAIFIHQKGIKSKEHSTKSVAKQWTCIITISNRSQRTPTAALNCWKIASVVTSYKNPNIYDIFVSFYSHKNEHHKFHIYTIIDFYYQVWSDDGCITKHSHSYKSIQTYMLTNNVHLLNKRLLVDRVNWVRIKGQSNKFLYTLKSR